MLRRCVRTVASWRLFSSSYRSVSLLHYKGCDDVMHLNHKPILTSWTSNLQAEKHSLYHRHHRRTCSSSCSSDAIEVALDSVVKIFTVSTSPNYLLPWQNKSQRETMGSGTPRNCNYDKFSLKGYLLSNFVITWL